ncbi:MAG: phosphatase PAP2 family protein [Bacteroidetes bacterium]|nr:phosphatase PAP2 family protein [Bacteroidota bacterium]
MKLLSGIKKKTGYNLYPIDIATIIYIIVSAIYICIGSYKLENETSHFISRLVILFFIFFISFINDKYDSEILKFTRNFYPILLLSYFYGETAYMNNIIFNNLDFHIVNLEQQLFGCQLSIEFSKRFPQKWFNELMNFGYFSYYFLTFIICFVAYITNRTKSFKVIFIVTASFYIYYIIFSIFPVVGPQFHFKGSMATIPDAYFFHDAVKFVQKIGEVPTGAFPSSHVGMALIFLYLSFKFLQKLFYYILPIIIILCFATVYIKAHYFVDVIAGVISAPLILGLSTLAYNKLIKIHLTDNRKVIEVNPFKPAKVNSN